MTQTSNAIESTDSPVFDTICTLVASLSNTEVIQHEHREIHDIPGKPRKDHIFYIFSYRRDFSKLWMEIDQEVRAFEDVFDRNSSAKSFSTVIVWDGYPQRNNIDAIPIENWVTPIDWAVCAGLSFDKQKNKPDWRVLIVDLVSQHYPSSKSTSLLKANPALLPWVRLYRPSLQDKHIAWKHQFVAEDDNWYALLRAMAKDDFTSLVEDIKSPKRVLGLNSSCDTLNALAPIWSANIVRPGDRHQVANLIAPMILFEAVKSSPATDALQNLLVNPLNSALMKQITTFQLIELSSVVENDRTNRAVTKIRGLLATCKKPKIVLIDDQYALGYDKLLSYIVGGKKIESEESAGKLFSKLDKHFQKVKGIETPGWRCSIYTEPTILLIDLRLWTCPSELRTFYIKLIAIMELYIDNIKEPSKNVLIKKVVSTEGRSSFSDKYSDNQREKLREDWDKIKSFLDADNPVENLLALSLLPRLISCVDPFLPIILFSSSGQRETIEAFHGHPNIITCFQKPMPAGYKAKLDPINYLEDLSRAFYKATQLCLLRPIGKNLCELEDKLYRKKMRIEIDTSQNGEIYNRDSDITSNMVCLDLRRATNVLLAEEYNYGSALPHLLIETWLNYNNEKRDKPNLKIIPIKGPYLKEARNAFSHTYADYSYSSNDSAVIGYIEKTLLPIWSKFFEYIFSCTIP